MAIRKFQLGKHLRRLRQSAPPEKPPPPKWEFIFSHRRKCNVYAENGAIVTINDKTQAIMKVERLAKIGINCTVSSEWPYYLIESKKE